MPKHLVVKVSCLHVLPTLALVTCCALCIVGNLIYMMTSVEGNTGYKINWWLWGAEGCSATTGACTMYGTTDYDRVVAPTGDCTTWIRQLRAAEAFGIISSVFAGVASIASGAVLVYQPVLTFPRVVIIGQLVCTAVMVVSVVEFVLVITLRGQSCINTISTTTTTFGAAPFLYIASFVVAVVGWCLYRTIGKREMIDSRRRLVAAPDARPYHQRITPRDVDSHDRAAAAPQQLPATVTPQNNTNNRIADDDDDDVEMQILPDGDDWELDHESGLLWSEERKLFFDQASGHFYDPGSEQWYDPDTRKWYAINHDGVMIDSSS